MRLWIVLIPAGEFEMGSPSDEAGRYYNEGPVHHVNIENAFYVGRYEVTQKQWREIMGDNPSYFNDGGMSHFLSDKEILRWESHFFERKNEYFWTVLVEYRPSVISQIEPVKKPEKSRDESLPKRFLRVGF